MKYYIFTGGFVATGIYITLYMLYGMETSSHILDSSYFYLLFSLAIALMLQYKKEIPLIDFYICFGLAFLYYLFSMTLMLICMYASPSDALEAKEAGYFFISGNIVLGSMLLNNTKVSTKNEEPQLVGIHRFIRYILYVIILYNIGRILFGLFNMYNIGLFA